MDNLNTVYFKGNKEIRVDCTTIKQPSSYALKTEKDEKNGSLRVKVTLEFYADVIITDMDII